MAVTSFFTDRIQQNPSITASCGNYITGRSYCVEAPSTGPTSAPPPTTTGNGIDTPLPTQTRMVGNCNRFHYVEEGQTCATIASLENVPLQQILNWNPAVGSSCGTIWAFTWLCVGTIDYTAPTTTAPPGNGITTPLPTQTGMVTNCDRFHYVEEGETCAVIAAIERVPVQKLIDWNPAVGSGCGSIWAFTWLCVRTIGYVAPTTTRTTTTTTTRRTTTTPGNGVSTPTPTQPGMVNNCNTFERVRSGDTCASIGARRIIAKERIISWHSSLTSACSNLFLDAYICVRTIGYTSANQVTCSTTAKTWGDNKAAALSGAGSWCDDSSSTDGTGNYGDAQVKRGCYNAPFGDNKIMFSTTNSFGAAGAIMSVDRCNTLVRLAINNCARGGVVTQEGWRVTAEVVAGRC